MRFRIAKPHDVAPVVSRFAGAFFKASGFAPHLTLDVPLAIETLEHAITKNTGVFLIADAGDEVAGFAGYGLSRTFTVEPVADLWMFYVDPRWKRRGAIARSLLYLCVDLAKADGAGVFCATVPTQRSACNLLRFMGFTPQAGAFSLSL